MEIRNMQLDDYDSVYDLGLNCPGMGLNNLDDSRDGIAKYLVRNPDTCFVAVEQETIIVQSLLVTMGAAAISATQRCYPLISGKVLVNGWSRLL